MVPTSRDAPLVHLAFGTAQQGCTESTFTHDVTSLVALESLELEQNCLINIHNTH